MWQLRKLSTSEALSEPGPLPDDWGPIFGLHNIKEKLGDLSWLGPAHADKGWFELTETELKQIRESEVRARVDAEKAVAAEALGASDLLLKDKVAWNDYLIALDAVCLSADFDCSPKFPIRPNAQVSN